MKLPNNWRLLNPKFSALLVDSLQKVKNCLPPKDQVLRAFCLTDPKEVKVIIIGQDPYHGLGQANGLAFSVNEGLPLPPSLKNIFKAISNDFCKDVSTKNGDLERWAKQGVFLINSILTVEENKPASHSHVGWQEFTGLAIEELSKSRKGLVFMLWGKYAQSLEGLIHHKESHLILKTVHPSPLSAYRGFLNCKHFSKCNAYLVEQGKEAVDWN